MENFVEYKNEILTEIINANYYLSSKDALEHLNIFTNIIYEYYLNETPAVKVSLIIMSYEPTIK
jgi:hypothetical protein